MKPTPIYQGDSRWSGLKLFDGPSTVGRGGCLLVDLTIAAREMGTHPGIIPPHAMTKITAAKGFIGDNIIVHTAATALGLLAPLSERVSYDDKEKPATQEELCAALLQALGNGMAILHVDHDKTRPGGDVSGDHFVLAYERDGGEIRCMDPAIGRVILGWPELDGVAVWGPKDVRTYRVRAVRPVRRLPT